MRIRKQFDGTWYVGIDYTRHNLPRLITTRHNVVAEMPVGFEAKNTESIDSKHAALKIRQPVKVK